MRLLSEKKRVERVGNLSLSSTNFSLFFGVISFGFVVKQDLISRALTYNNIKSSNGLAVFWKVEP